MSTWYLHEQQKNRRGLLQSQLSFRVLANNIVCLTSQSVAVSTLESSPVCGSPRG